MSQRALEKLVSFPVAVLKSKPKMGPKNGVRKPAQKSVALTVASPVRADGGCSKSPKKGGVICVSVPTRVLGNIHAQLRTLVGSAGNRKNETLVGPRFGVRNLDPRTGPCRNIFL